jgi:pimeloyl-ACP methyl ester carboxylesterase
MFSPLISLATSVAARMRGLSSSIVEIGEWRLKVWRGGVAGGEPWLLLHGMGATSATYFPLLGELKRDCRIVVPELSANGGTKGPGAALGVAAGTEIIARLIEREFPGERPTVCGVSLGGWIAVRLAARRPDLVARLVLVVPGGYRDQDWRRIESMVRVSKAAEIDAMWDALFFRPPWFLRLGKRSLYRLYSTPTVREVLAAVREEDAFDDADLARLDMPVALVWGENDLLFRKEVGERMLRALPRATLTVIPNSGHAAQWEKPREVVAAVRAFRARFPLRTAVEAEEDR